MIAAQTPARTISGTVKTKDGIPIPGATVTAVSAAGNKLVAFTDEQGSYFFSSLTEDSYDLEAEIAGFKREARRAIKVQDGSVIQVDFTLLLGAINPAEEPRQMRDRQPGAGQQQRGNRPWGAGGGQPGPRQDGQRAPNRQGAPDRQGQEADGAFQNLALSGSETGNAAPQRLADIAQPPQPGVDNLPGNALESSTAESYLISGSVNMAFQGGPGGGAGREFGDGRFGLPGDGPLADRIAQAIEARGAGGGGGRGGFGGPGGGGPAGGGFGGFGGPGGGRGGPFGRARANRLIFNLFSIYRNSVFDARPYSLSGIEQEKKPYLNNTFGASVGGPLTIPHIYNGSSKTSFFINYQGGRSRNSFDSTTTVPTAAERAGDFSQTLIRGGVLAGQPVRIFDPLTADPATGKRQPFTNNVIPADRMDPRAAFLLRFIPLPNLPGAVQNFYLQQTLPSTNDSINARIDHHINASNNLSINYNFNRQRQQTGQVFPDLLTNQSTRNQNANINYIHNFSRTFFNEARFQFNRNRVFALNRFAFNEDIEGQIGIKGVSRDPINYGIPTITFTNYGALQDSNPRIVRNQTWSFSDNITYMRRSHSIRAGAEFRRVLNASNTDINGRGTFTFSGFSTSDFDPLGRPIPASGYDFADFLLGLPQSTSIRFGGNNTYFISHSFAGYFQDNWRARSYLTVNYGVRYELTRPPVEKYNRIANLDVAPGFTAVAVVLPGQMGPYSGEFPRSLIETDWNNIGPRIGIAYRPFRRSQTIVRVGYGVFFTPNYNQFTTRFAAQPPFAVAQNLLTSPTNVLTLENGFPTIGNFTVFNTYAVDKNYRANYVQNWNLGIQHQLTRALFLNINYLGTKGAHLDLLIAPNRAPLGSSPGNTEPNRQIANAQSFNYQTSAASSIMHAVNVGLQKRFTRGVMLMGNYTFGKSIDNAASIGGGAQLVVLDNSNYRGERSLSQFDVRHRFVFAYNYELPFGGRNRLLSGDSLLGKVLSNWQMNGNVNLSSGAPLTPRLLGNALNNSGTGANQSERPDATGQQVSLPRSERSIQQFFNTAAFALPPPGRFGNAGRNVIPGPGNININFSVTKRIRFSRSENRNLEVRWQANNIFNHPNFGGVNTVVNSTAFGRVTSVRQMRTMQFDLRLRF